MPGISDNPGRTAAVIIDINGAKPKVTFTAPMPLPLNWHNATLGADGRVIVTGGSYLANQLVGVNDRALIWNPATGAWTEGARTASGRARMYHSTALLLPDASILVAGGGAGGNSPVTNLDAEIYYPPYLYDGSGQFAPRPRITGGATALKYKGLHNIKVDNGAAIARVTLIKTGSVTHGFDMEQRFLQLAFTRRGQHPEGPRPRQRQPRAAGTLPAVRHQRPGGAVVGADGVDRTAGVSAVALPPAAQRGIGPARRRMGRLNHEGGRACLRLLNVARSSGS